MGKWSMIVGKEEKKLWKNLVEEEGVDGGGACRQSGYLSLSPLGAVVPIL